MYYLGWCLIPIAVTIKNTIAKPTYAFNLILLAKLLKSYVQSPSFAYFCWLDNVGIT